MTNAPKRMGRPPIDSHLEPGAKTPQRQVRMGDEWFALQAKARDAGYSSGSEVIRLLVNGYLAGDIRLPDKR